MTGAELRRAASLERIDLRQVGRELGADRPPRASAEERRKVLDLASGDAVVHVDAIERPVHWSERYRLWKA